MDQEAEQSSHVAFKSIYRIGKRSRVRVWVLGIFIGLILVLFLPWTQNIRTTGSVTTLQMQDRPQEINAIIGGRIEKWFVKEGDMVKKGDTLIKISEVKVDYLDPDLLLRINQQLDAKLQGIENYKGKVSAADMQIQALMEAQQLKISQLRNKLEQQRLKYFSDSMEMIAARNEWNLANKQFQRQQQMYDSGLVSLTQLEQRNISYQNALAKKTTSEIKWNNTRNEMNVLNLEISAAVQDYNEKISKITGDKFQSQYEISSGQSEVAKLRNQYASYDLRSKMYSIIAPQDGQVINAKKAGIGEILKDGEMILTIVPAQRNLCVELFIEPMDMPLIQMGQKVRFTFDGFPAVVFSGWPKASYGTFGGVVAAIENNIGTNGKFRVLVKEDPDDRKWPPALRIGSGAQAMMLLKNVPIWYELWRNINGFPPDYYKVKDDDSKTDKKEKKTTQSKD